MKKALKVLKYSVGGVVAAYAAYFVVVFTYGVAKYEFSGARARDQATLKAYYSKQAGRVSTSQ